MQSHVQSLEGELGTLRQAFEEKTRGAGELEQALSEERSVTARMQSHVQSLEGELGTLRQAFEEKTQSSLDLEHICNELKDAGGQALAQIRALDSEIEQLHAALEEERHQHAATRQSLQGALQERDTALSSLQGAHHEVKSDLDSHREDLALAKQELAAVTGERAALNNRLLESAALIRSLEEKLAASSGDQAESDKQIRALSDELDQVKAALETERRQRRTDEENIRSAVMEKEKAGETARRIADEQERIKKMLESEQEERRNAEARLRTLEEESEQRVRDLSDTLTEARGKIAESEEQLKRVTQEKEEAQKLAASLEAEIEQARAALADEWEDHVTDNERFAAVVESAVPGPAANPPAVISQNPDLPATVTAAPKAVVAAPSPPAGTPPLTVTRVEDLFEDDEEEDLPSVTIIRDPVPEDPGMDFVPGVAGDEGDDEDLRNDGEEIPNELEEAGDEDSIDEEDEDPAPSFNPMAFQPATQFDRSQWLDLLKWAHHSGALSQEQRLRIVRMGRLIQNGRRLTHKQEAQVREMIALAQSLGYRFT
jgi:chromosome segregation ATPase